MSTLFPLLLLALLVAAWYQLRGLHERAFLVCKKQLAHAGLQLLDDSVAFKGFSLGKPIARCHCLQRCYRFEYAENGLERLNGQLWFCGKQAVFMVLEHTDGQREWINLKR